jgi:cytochrome b
MAVSDDDQSAPARVRVWDLPVRIFHWTIVALIATSWIAADRGFMRIHLWSGSALLALLLFRLVWGIVGSTTARFSDFVHSPRATFRYLRALAAGEKPRYAGHNPAGGWMVVVLLACLSAQVGTGLFANDGLEFMGPLALLVTADASDRLTSLHGWLFYVLLLLIWLHVVAAFFYLFVKRENLITPMMTGKKSRPLVPGSGALHFARAWLAGVLFVLSAGVAWWIVGT